MTAVMLIRHGQTVFNAAWLSGAEQPVVPDPGLTTIGVNQVLQLKEWLAARTFDEVFTSPYSRALETVRLCGLNSRARVELCLREDFVHACDVGSQPEVLAHHFPEFQLRHIPRDWWLQVNPIKDRAREFCQLLNEHRGGRIAVVGHRGFFQALARVDLENCEVVEIELDDRLVYPHPGVIRVTSVLWRPDAERY